MSKRALGKGLSALIGEAAGTQPQRQEAGSEGKPAAPPLLAGREATMLSVDELVANPHQPRRHMDDEKLEELAASIRENGVLQPVLVRRTPMGYELVAGERRLRASRLAGQDQIPALVCTMDDEESLKLALLENIQREDLSPLEEAEAYQAIMDRLGATHQEVAKMLGKSRSSVSNTLRLLKLEATIRELVESRELSMGHARALLGVEEGPERLRLARKVLRQGMSVRALEEEIQGGGPGARPGARREPGPARPAPRDPDAAALGAFEGRLREKLGAPTRIRRRGQKGRIELDFFDNDDLERLLGLMGVDPQL